MNTPNRKKVPEIHTVERIILPKVKKSTLPGGTELYALNMGDEEVIKVDLIIEGGSWYQHKNLVASSCCEILTEGTQSYTSRQIADLMDYYGAFIMNSTTKDQAFLSLFSLKKHLAKTLPILAEMFYAPVFPKSEFEIYLKKKFHRWRIENEKTSVLARKKFQEALFGANHPYGRQVKEEDFTALQQDDLVKYHATNYLPARLKILVSGKLEEDVLQLIEKHFSPKGHEHKSAIKTTTKQMAPASERRICIAKKNAAQSSLRIGKRTIGKAHPDFIGFDVLNTALGGYFGSRLMKNIREEKGYTYGINSVLVPMAHGSYWAVVSELGNEYLEPALEAVYDEIEKLRKVPISNEELLLVKNYMMGDLQRSFDGPFSTSSVYKTIIENNLDLNYPEYYMKTIKSLTSDKLLELARKYLDPQDMYEVVAGGQEMRV